MRSMFHKCVWFFLPTPHSRDMVLVAVVVAHLACALVAIDAKGNYKEILTEDASKIRLG